MERSTVILIVTTSTLVGLIVGGVFAWRVYQKVAPTITGLQGDYQGIGGLINLLRGGSTTPAAT